MKKYFKITSLVLSLILFIGLCILAFFEFSEPDYLYKRALIKNSTMPIASVKRLKSIAGEKELIKIIKNYDSNETAYWVDRNTKGDSKIFNTCGTRANLHMHTTSSDGSMSVEELLNQAADYADFCKAVMPKEEYPFVIALTDHNTVAGDKIAIETILHNPQRYKNLKVVLGMEIWAQIEKLPSQAVPNQIHMLAWAINPYSDVFNIFDGKWRELEFTFVTKIINSQKYGLIGVAHPIREIHEDALVEGKTLYDWVEDMFKLYVSQRKNKPLFTEAYYQRYRFNKEPQLLDFIKESAKKYNIIRTGSLDTHSDRLEYY